ncbi:hypothetical protein O6H91_13G052200 [Diphasiastrum complanatum]|uniref:Uncharacterized protein n=1 Tax=Diphasiastrum complanatum TaxID=34168 RepID=A0ACC2BUP4_DIPCM|nr:hypothetical protein O6H91_13G052200 [Diphasiastrum complanatum]
MASSLPFWTSPSSSSSSSMAFRSALFRCVYTFLLIALTFFGSSAECTSLQSVPDLEKAMYHIVDGVPCVRLLSLYGEIGCANPGSKTVIAPIKRVTSLSFKLTRPTAVLLPYMLLLKFLQRSFEEPSFAEYVAGILVEFVLERNNGTKGSPDGEFPQREFAPYQDKSYAWNPLGSGVLHQRYNFPVFLLTQNDTQALQEAAATNENQNIRYPLNVAEFDVVMQTTKSATHTSESCLNERSCLPLGGYSVWSSLPPLNVSSTSSNKPVIIVIASMDSASLFRDQTHGADSPLSGMIAMLAAVDALSMTAGIDTLQKQLVFLVCTGEAWGYLGSRRFLLELAAGNPSVAGLDPSLVSQIIEIGSVGRAMDDGVATFYAHTQGSQFQVSTGTQEILEALKTASTTKDIIKSRVETASRHNPGVPPSSLMSFLQQNASIAGVVLEEFDTHFKNELYHSHLDDFENINISAITAAGSILARTLYQLGTGTVNASSEVLQSITVNSSLVQELVGCLLTFKPGMMCDLVKDLITPTQPYANHYVGVLLGRPSSSPMLENVDDTSRFIWNFLADRTDLQKISRKRSDVGNKSTIEKCSQTCRTPNTVCVGSTVDHQGTCKYSTVRYVPAYSPRLQYKSSGWRLLPLQTGIYMDDVDPVWTESFWKTTGARVYLQESSSYDEVILIGGSGITICSIVAIISARAVFRKRIKRA